ncbi:MAG: winged helix-turn-helix domain-containing protein [Ktedonobacteraceae bacterium]|nr:winged helix-turn-helix domain-containing protein [Ktedonobacteraceae bacterium]
MSSRFPAEQRSNVPVGFTREYAILAEVCGSMSSGFVLLDQREHLTYCNQSALRLLRVQQTTRDFDLRGHLRTLVADPQPAHSELDRLWQAPGQESVAEIALIEGAVRWLRVRSFPVRDHQDILLGRGVLLEDITLERSVAEARSESLAMAAHELKTPLAVIKGCATTLLGSSARWDPAMQREMLQMIDAQSDRLYDVLNTLLDVWRFEAGAQSLRLVRLQLAELLLRLVKNWQSSAPSHRLVLDIPPDIPEVMCDALRIEQVMNNLLDNAVSCSPPASAVRIQLEANEVEVRVSVADEGIGIAPEHLERIFDRFYRIDPGDDDHRGSGLGLASARATVEAHGGKIWADSLGTGQGSTIYFTLPFNPRLLVPRTPTQMASALASPSTPIPASPPITPGVLGNPSYSTSLKHERRASVLLAESDPRLTRYLRANLEEQHYRVHTVNHGVQCLRQLDLEEPDIILLSTHLVDMSGIELLRRLREFSQTPVIMLSDDCDEDERVHLFDLGGDDLVVKPFGIKELLARVRALLRRHQSAASPPARQSVFVSGDLVIDHAQHIVTVEGRQVQLSRTEYRLLSLLAQNAGLVVTHELLLEKVWGPEYHRDVDFIWVYISRLRRKIESDPRHPRYIQTVPDVGYKLVRL